MYAVTFRVVLLSGAGALASGNFMTCALAAEAGPQESEALQEITVTGSRVSGTSAFNAPTPVTAISTETMLQSSPSNLPDALNKMMPQFAASQSENRPTTVRTLPVAGNFLNLRNLGPTRSLVLFDGHRVPPTSFDGSVNTNVLPQLLVERVEVVTGGASAVYGSDAVVGVVNFILNKDFQGVKGTLQGSTSTDGISDAWRAGFAAGGSLFDGRLHLLASAEHYTRDPITRAERPVKQNLPMMVGGGTASDPLRYAEGVTYNTAAFGGMIFSGPLVNNVFNPDGTIRPMNRGTATLPTGFAIGGEGAYLVNALWSAAVTTDQAFGRASFDITDGLTLYSQVTAAEARNKMAVLKDPRLPGQQQITIFAENAFLRPEVRAGLGTTPSFVLTRYGRDFPESYARMGDKTLVASLGLDGRLKWGSDWSWNVQYDRGNAKMSYQGNESFMPRMYAAADAVLDPASGTIVCRVSLTNPGLYPGCVPINYFGEGSPSQAAIDYVYGVPAVYETENDLDLISASAQGKLFSLWAGPVTLAFGGEYRKQRLVQTSNSDPATPPTFFGLRGVAAGAQWFLASNIGSADGSVQVKEGFIELDVPLARDIFLVDSLALNAAYRYTDYSTSGRSPSWKLGLTYEPTAEVRLRAALSSDIRAPSLYDLFASVQSRGGQFTDIHTGLNQSVSTITRGNLELTPERGRTWTAGIGYRPEWASNAMLSVDFFHIEIADAIGTIGSAQANIACEASGGTSPECALFVRPLPFADRSAANFPTAIIAQSLNLVSIEQSGMDVDFAFRFSASSLVSAWRGDLGIRAIATHTRALETQNTPSSAIIDTAGVGYTPKWRGNINLTYDYGPLSVGLLNRFTGRSKRDAVVIYADHGVNPNRVYTDLNVSYDLAFGGTTLESFLTVGNLLDVEPPLLPGNIPLGLYPTLLGVYDIVGTYLTVGARVRF